MSLISVSRCLPEELISAAYSIVRSGLVLEEPAGDHLRKAQDRVQRRAQFVAHIGEELRFGQACGLGLLAAAVRFQLGHHQLGQKRIALLGQQDGGACPVTIAARDQQR